MGNLALLENVANRVILLWGWKRIAVAALAGAVSALAMPPMDLGPILFLTLPIAIWLIDSTAADPKTLLLGRFIPAFKLGWWFGFGYFLAGLWWVGSALLVEADQYAWALPIAVLGLPGLLAIFWGFAFGLASLTWSDGWRRIVVFAAYMALAEYSRGTVFTGFPWNSIGYAAMFTLVGQQSVAQIGLNAMNLLAVLVFSVGAMFAPGSGQRPRRLRLMLVTALVLSLAHFGYGYYRLSLNPTQYIQGVSLRIVQPGISQAQKWEKGREREIFDRYLDLSKKPQAAGFTVGKATHYIWPESAFPFLLTERPDALASIGELLPKQSFLITGAARAEPSSDGVQRARFFNSVYVINDQGEISGASDKLHLVPFGEYLPLQAYMERLGLRQLTGLEGGFTPAFMRSLLSAGTAGSFLPLICYEIIFPAQVRADVNRLSIKNSPAGPTWLLNVTNDAWFGVSFGPYQHVRQAIIRGIENGLPVVRAANSGVSVVTDAYGRIVAQLGLNEIGVLDSGLPQPAAGTGYRSIGDWIYFLLTIIFLIVGLLPLTKKKL